MKILIIFVVPNNALSGFECLRRFLAQQRLRIFFDLDKKGYKYLVLYRQCLFKLNTFLFHLLIFGYINDVSLLSSYRDIQKSYFLTTWKTPFSVSNGMHVTEKKTLSRFQSAFFFLAANNVDFETTSFFHFKRDVNYSCCEKKTVKE